MNPFIEKLFANMNKDQVFEKMAERVDKAANKTQIWDTISNFLGEILNPTRDDNVGEHTNKQTTTSNNKSGAESEQAK